jgi:hypothetical protein
MSKTDCHDIAEILLKVALNTITPLFVQLHAMAKRQHINE